MMVDEDVECGCECQPDASSAYACLHGFNNALCQCECPAWKFGPEKDVCESKRDHIWDARACQCKRLPNNSGDDLCANLEA